MMTLQKLLFEKHNFVSPQVRVDTASRNFGSIYLTMCKNQQKKNRKEYAQWTSQKMGIG